MLKTLLKQKSDTDYRQFWLLTVHAVVLLFHFILTLWHSMQDLPQPGIKPVPPAVETPSLNHWTTRKSNFEF